jgi:hypothetical protein
MNTIILKTIKLLCSYNHGNDEYYIESHTEMGYSEFEYTDLNIMIDQLHSDDIQELAECLCENYIIWNNLTNRERPANHVLKYIINNYPDINLAKLLEIENSKINKTNKDDKDNKRIISDIITNAKL